MRLMKDEEKWIAAYLTGDIHGNPGRFGDSYLAEHYHLPPLTAEDNVIICGDLGLPWSEYMPSSEEYWLDWLNPAQKCRGIYTTIDVLK